MKLQPRTPVLPPFLVTEVDQHHFLKAFFLHSLPLLGLLHMHYVPGSQYSHTFLTLPPNGYKQCKEYICIHASDLGLKSRIHRELFEILQEPEMGQLVKCLLCTLEDMNSASEQPHRKSGVVALGSSGADPWCSLTNQSTPFMRNYVLKDKVKSD